MSAQALVIRTHLRYPPHARVGGVCAVEVYLEHDTPGDQWPHVAEECPIRCFLLCDEAVFVQEAIGDGTVVLHRRHGTYGPSVFRLRAVGAGRCDLRVLLVDRRGTVVGTPSARGIEVAPAWSS